MSGFDEDDVFATETNADDRDNHGRGAFGRLARSARALSMFDNVRGTMYSAMAGLIYAGIGMEESATILADEYRKEKMEDAATSVTIFFTDTVRALAMGDRRAAAEIIGEAALRAFGTKFVGPEEMALLKALAVSQSPDRILQACAAIIGQYERDRISGSGSTFRRFAS
jgi:hypothetical protein